MVMDETTFVTHPRPIDVTGVREPAVQALIILATSLGWNVMMKRGQPAVLTGRDGTQKRLATDQSIRMSVFQTALSTIMVHSEDMEPTIDLIEAIIKTTKPSRDHQRRLRLAVGETPADHRERLLNAERRPRDDISHEEHLTQRIEVPTEEDTSALREGLMVPPSGPADGADHGEMVSRGPFFAHYSGNTSSGAYTYQSKTSLERVWEDGFKDYECVVCGRVFVTPRGVGGHRQQHIKAGEVEAVGSRPYQAADAVIHKDTSYVSPKVMAKAAETLHFVDELPPTEVAEAIDVQREYMGKLDAEEEPEHEITPEVAEDALTLLDAIAKLMQPRLARKYEEKIAELILERDEAQRRLAEVEGEFDALVEMLTSRKKP